jgi:hypothetical protein
LQELQNLRDGRHRVLPQMRSKIDDSCKALALDRRRPSVRIAVEDIHLTPRLDPGDPDASLFEKFDSQFKTDRLGIVTALQSSLEETMGTVALSWNKTDRLSFRGQRSPMGIRKRSFKPTKHECQLAIQGLVDILALWLVMAEPKGSRQAIK